MASRPRCSCERRWEGQRKHPAPLQQPLSTFLEAAPSPALNRITTASQASPGLEAGPKLSTASFVQQQLLRPSEPSQLQLAGDRDGGDVLPPILVLPPHPSPLLPLLPGLLYSLPTRSPLFSPHTGQFPSPPLRGGCSGARSCLVADPMLSSRWSPAAYCSFQLFSHCSHVLHGPALRCPPRVYPFSPNTT